MYMRLATIALLLSWPVVLMAQATPTPPAPRSNGASPRVSPDGSRILFSSNRDGPGDLYVINPDGSGITRVTNSVERSGPADWTADGKHILFSTFKTDTTTLYAADPAGGSSRPLAKVAGRGLILSEDGKRLIYTVGTFQSNRLVESDLDGGNARELSSGAEVIFNPKLSPDGGRIAYTRMDSTRMVQVWVMNRDGSGAHAVTHFVPAAGRPQVPAWSPDGKHLAFQANVHSATTPPQSSSHIWIVDLETDSLTKLAAHDRPYLDETPSWFSDGRRIAFQSDRTGQMEIWLMNVDGSGARQVTR